MPLPAGFELEQQPAAAVKLPPGFQLDAPSQLSPSFTGNLGRGLASLVDVTVGGVVPAVVQQVGYPLARLGRSDTEAQNIVNRVSAPFQQPVGRLFGVTETPEYKQEMGRQVMDFIAQNAQKGVKWISEKTGLPTADVENMLGSATIAAPTVVKPVAQTVNKLAAPVIDQAAAAVKLPFEKQIQARRERQSLEDYARGPQIDAVKDAQRMGLALNPVDVQPTAGPKFTSMVAGEKGERAVADFNKGQIRNIVISDLDLPPTTQLNGPKAFDAARAKVADPYDQVKKLPIQQADDAMVKRLESIRADLDVIGAKEYAPAISKIVDDAIAKTQTGLTGEQLLKNISVLRERARKTYNNKSATTEALDIADTNLKVATELESLIDNSIFNPKLLSDYRAARAKMAKTYAYEGATDFNTGLVDVSKLARITAKDNGLTGDIAALGRVAGNFPDAFTTQVATPWTKAAQLARTGAAGTLGGMIGYAVGDNYLSAALGSVAGAGLGELGQSMAARRVASPEYQASLKLRDMRLPINNLATAVQPIPQNRALVPYEAPVAVLAPGQGPYQPNFVLQPNQYGPRVTTPGFAPSPAQLPAPSAGGTINALRAEDVRRAGVSRALGQQAEAQAAAAEAAGRRPTSGAVELQINPLTGVPEIASGVKGATPEIFMADTGANLQSAAQKATAGKLFDMTAAEKVAWDKVKVDLADVVPGMKTLNDKAIAAKMQDRAWVQDAITKAQDQARAFQDIASRANTERMRQDALMKREQMMDLLETLEGQFSKARPVKTGGQGPKTRAAQRNMLRPGDDDIQNALVK